MATQTVAPPNPIDDKPQNPVSEVVQPKIEDQHDAKAEANGGISSTSAFVNSERMREEQVQNAVKFLSHPKVRGSSVIYRRSFLERKGLTKEEIDEAFRRVPDPPPTVSSAQPAGTNRGGRFHWSHTLYVAVVIVVAGVSTAILYKIDFFSRLISWIRKFVFKMEEESAKKTNSKPSLEQEAAAAAKAAADAAADVARASQEMLSSKTEEKKYLKELMNLIEVQVHEMKSMSDSIRKLEARSSLLLATVVPSIAPRLKSDMEIMAMIQKGERPPNIREINDLPPNPNQPIPNPNLAPRAKPWEIGHTQNNFGQVLQSHESSGGLNPNSQNNGLINLLNGDGSAPWWQRKNVGITEIENEDELKTGSSSVLANKQPVQQQRLWVPPQPTPVAIPEAAGPQSDNPKNHTISETVG